MAVCRKRLSRKWRSKNRELRQILGKICRVAVIVLTPVLRFWWVDTNSERRDVPQTERARRWTEGCRTGRAAATCGADGYCGSVEAVVWRRISFAVPIASRTLATTWAARARFM